MKTDLELSEMFWKNLEYNERMSFAAFKKLAVELSDPCFHKDELMRELIKYNKFTLGVEFKRQIELYLSQRPDEEVNDPLEYLDPVVKVHHKTITGEEYIERLNDEYIKLKQPSEDSGQVKSRYPYGRCDIPNCTNKAKKTSCFCAKHDKA
jgi:hypothetical protein